MASATLKKVDLFIYLNTDGVGFLVFRGGSLTAASGFFLDGDARLELGFLKMHVVQARLRKRVRCLVGMPELCRQFAQ